ncbi:MAG: hypothetical protein AAFR61_10915 [Bacteroidota bacterium]
MKKLTLFDFASSKVPSPRKVRGGASTTSQGSTISCKGTDYDKNGAVWDTPNEALVTAP